MNIFEKIMLINNGITAIKNAFKLILKEKNVVVDDSLKLKGYPSLFKNIEVGGNVDLTNLLPENIKKDVVINGVTGTYEGDALNIVVSDTEPANPVEGMIWIDTSVADDEGDSEGGEAGGESGGGSSGGGNGTLFRVSGAGSTEANGDYFDTGETKNNLPIYKNENNIYMYFSNQCGYSWASGWCLSPTVIDEGSGMLYCTVASSADTYPTNMLSSWSTLDGVTPVPVCRKLDENGNEIIPADYTVTGAGTEAVNGDYYATGEYLDGTNGPIYKNANNVYLFGNGSNCYFAFEAVYSPACYYTCETYTYDIQTGNWETDAIYPSLGSGTLPYPTVKKG